MAELVSERYASVLFGTAMEDHLQAQIRDELNMLSAILTENSDYVKILSSPIVGLKEKHELAAHAFEGKLNSYLLNLIYVMIDNNRFMHFFAVVTAYNRLCDRENNILRVTAVTAISLSAEMKEKLQAKLCTLSGKNVMLSNEVDESLIGGILLKYDNTEIDGSVKTQLDAIKKQIRAKTF